MKNTFTAAALVLVMSGPAFAGGLDDPIVEEDVVVEETSTSGDGGWLIPVLFLIFGAAVAG